MPVDGNQEKGGGLWCRHLGVGDQGDEQVVQGMVPRRQLDAAVNYRPRVMNPPNMSNETT